MARNQFIDPSGAKPSYQWTVNHTTEEPVQNSRQIGSGSSTDNIGLIPQQGSPIPKVFGWKGTIFTQTDKNEMDSWYRLCETQSIYLIDPTGSEYEVLITDWEVNREGVANNKRGGNIPYLWQYTITFRILRVISGDWLSTEQ